MTIRSFAVAVTVLSLATVAPAAQAVADDTIVSFSKTYSEPELAAVCSRVGGLSVPLDEGVYGCIKGVNNVRCRQDGACTGFIRTPLAFSGPGADRDVGAETVLRMPSTPALPIVTPELTGGTASGAPDAPQ